jgi:RNA polymerase sigma-70 factor (ECF subfamily)
MTTAENALGVNMLGMKRSRELEFEAEAMPYIRDLYRAAARMLPETTRADDVVQDVYLEAWKSFDRFEVGTNCRAWLYKILFHVIQHHRRKWFNVRMVQEGQEFVEQAPAATPSIPEHLTDAEILTVLDHLPLEFRAAVLLVDVEEFSYKEAARIQNVPIGTVMSRLSRGRKLLRDQLGGLAQSYGIGKAKLEGRSA